MSNLSRKKKSLVIKMSVGFAAMAFFTFTAMSLSFIGLYSMHNTAKDIARHDLFIIKSADNLRDILQDQDAVVAKYALQNNSEYLSQFRRYEAEFLALLEKVRPVMPAQEAAIIVSRYREYRKQAGRIFAGDADALNKLRKLLPLLMMDLEQFEKEQQSQVEERLREADRRERQTIVITLVLSLTGFILAGIVALLMMLNISKAMEKLKKATNRIAEGDFDYDPMIAEGDEVGDLAQSFTRMAVRLKELEQYCLDASPLTRLPGNIAIERALTRKLLSGESFAFCYADLDNFKAYNDSYGYHQASEVIKRTGQIIDETVRQFGGVDYFVGHIGGDDFVMFADQGHVEALCQTIIERFSSMIVQHYSAEDLSVECIKGIDRYGTPRTFPIMTISIAVLMCNHGDYVSSVAIARTAAEIKEHVKGLPGSNYFINRRGDVLREVSPSSTE